MATVPAMIRMLPMASRGAVGWSPSTPPPPKTTAKEVISPTTKNSQGCPVRHWPPIFMNAPLR